jgi:translation initiation factor 3 subunit L
MADKRTHESTNPDIESDVPGEVIDFLERLSAALLAKDMDALQPMYEVELQQLTDRFYTIQGGYGQRKIQTKHWPQAKFLKGHFGHQQVELVYQLHHFRTQYSDRQVNPVVRKNAWATSAHAFETLTADSVVIDLPNGWIWDIIDEFVYQLQVHRIKRLRPEQAQSLPSNCWVVPEATAKLETLVVDTGIRALLARIEGGSAQAAELTGRGPRHLQNVLGLAALVGIVKLRVLLGDYVGALEAAEPLVRATAGASLTVSIPPLHAALYYHVGFAYIMLRRYADAASALPQALAVNAGNRKYLEQLQTHVVSLLLIANTLGDLPAADLAFVGSGRSTQDEDATLLAQGDLERYRDVFLRSCPKFFTAADVTSGSTTGFSETGQEAKELQLRMFLRGVRQQLDVLKLRGYLNAYSTLANEKVASLLAASSAVPVEAHLVALKRNARQRVNTKGATLSGELKRTAVVDFTADKGSIAVQRHFEQPTVAAAFFDKIIEAHRKGAKAAAPGSP